MRLVSPWTDRHWTVSDLNSNAVNTESGHTEGGLVHRHYIYPRPHTSFCQLLPPPAPPSAILTIHLPTSHYLRYPNPLPSTTPVSTGSMTPSMALLLLVITFLVQQASGLSIPRHGLALRNSQASDNGAARNFILSAIKIQFSHQSTKAPSIQDLLITIGSTSSLGEPADYDFVSEVTDLLSAIRSGPGLGPVAWDDELAVAAQSAADQCKNASVSGEGVYGTSYRRPDTVISEFDLRIDTFVAPWTWGLEWLHAEHLGYDSIVQSDAKTVGCAWSQACEPNHFMKCIFSAQSNQQAVSTLHSRDEASTHDTTDDLVPFIGYLRNGQGISVVMKEPELTKLAYLSASQCNGSRLSIILEAPELSVAGADLKPRARTKCCSMLPETSGT